MIGACVMNLLPCHAIPQILIPTRWIPQPILAPVQAPSGGPKLARPSRSSCRPQPYPHCSPTTYHPRVHSVRCTPLSPALSVVNNIFDPRSRRISPTVASSNLRIVHLRRVVQRKSFKIPSPLIRRPRAVFDALVWFT
jgi:hypothetical protein